MAFWFDHPCLSTIVYEFMNVTDVVNLAMTNHELGERLLHGYIKWMRGEWMIHWPSSMILQIRWLRTMPTQALDGCRRDRAKQLRILRSYSSRFLPWYKSVNATTVSYLFHMFRVEIYESLYIGLGLHPWVRDSETGRVYTLNAPAHMIHHPTKPNIVFATFEVRGDFLFSWTPPMNQHLSPDTIDEILSRLGFLVAATTQLTSSLSGIYGIKALITPGFAHHHRCVV